MPVGLTEWRVRIGRFIQNPPDFNKQEMIQRFLERWKAKKEVSKTPESREISASQPSTETCQPSSQKSCQHGTPSCTPQTNPVPTCQPSSQTLCQQGTPSCTPETNPVPTYQPSSQTSCQQGTPSSNPQTNRVSHSNCRHPAVWCFTQVLFTVLMLMKTCFQWFSRPCTTLILGQHDSLANTSLLSETEDFLPTSYFGRGLHFCNQLKSCVGFCVLYLSLILLTRAGDVETNPGPESTVSEMEFLKLAQAVPLSSYTAVGISLEIPFAQTQAILAQYLNNYTNALQDIFMKWNIKQLPDTNKREVLAHKLLEIDLGDLSNKLRYGSLIPTRTVKDVADKGSDSDGNNIPLGDLSVPYEILARGQRAQQAYKEAAQYGTKKIFRTRLMLVGQERVGKTSLKKSLLTGQKFDENETITDGIETCEISVNGATWSINKEEHDNLKEKAIAEEIANKLRAKTQAPESIEPESKLTSGRASDSVNSVKKEAASKDEAPKDDDRMPAHVEGLVENSLKEQDRKKESGADGGKDDTLSLDIWDFAGQDVYYTTHQVFLTWRAVYVIVFDLSKSLDSIIEPEYRDKEHGEINGAGKSELTYLQFINFWLCSIFAHAVAPDSVTTKYTGKTAQESPPIFIVGTHRDSIKGNEKEQKIASAFAAIHKTIKKKPFACHMIQKFYAIENSLDGNDEQLNALRERIVEVAKDELYMGEEIPLKYLDFEEMLQPKSLAKMNSMKMGLDEIKEVTRPVGLESEDQLLTMLIFYHELGYIVYYGDIKDPKSPLRDIVILNPQWLIDVFKQVITIPDRTKRDGIMSDAWSILEDDGILEDRLILHMWQGFLDHKDALVELMAKFDLLCEVSEVKEVDRKRYYVPSLINSRFPDEEMTSIKSSIFYADFKGFLPDGLFHRLMTRAVRWIEQQDGLPVDKQEDVLYHRHISMKVDGDNHALLKMLPPDEAMIEVTVYQPDGIRNAQRSPAPLVVAVKKVKDFLTKSLDNLTKHWAKRIEYNYRFPCPTCNEKKLFKDFGNGDSIHCGKGLKHNIEKTFIESKYGEFKSETESPSLKRKRKMSEETEASGSKILRIQGGPMTIEASGSSTVSGNEQCLVKIIINQGDLHKDESERSSEEEAGPSHISSPSSSP